MAERGRYKLLYMATCLLSNSKSQNEQKTCPTNLEQPWQTESTFSQTLQDSKETLHANFMTAVIF